jgi:hypothetical protein
VIEQKASKIIDIREAKGIEHDFKVYKETIGESVHKAIRIDADMG